jgi:restriction system protein
MERMWMVRAEGGTLYDMARALVEHYDATDTETKRLVPLKRMYWPA